MEWQWSDLGLSQVWVDGPKGRVLYGLDADAPSSESRNPPNAIYIVYPDDDADSTSEEAFDVRAFARALFPTLSEYRIENLREHCDVPREKVHPQDLLHVLRCLIGEALTLDRQVVASLAQLAPPPMANVLEKILTLPIASPSVSSVDEQNETRNEPVAVASSAADALTPGGRIAEAFGTFEARPGQLAMAEEVEAAFSEGLAALVEAGPGTGKTFAYLVPALLHLLRNPADRVLISTRTRQLQEQLYRKDLPFLLEQLAPSLNVALLKGRENYLCLRRWHALVDELTGQLERDLVLPRLAPLVRWIVETETGDIEENSAFWSDPQARSLWYRLCDAPHHCTEAFCPFSEECFSIRARRRARRADLVVVNHSLLLSDLGVDGVVLGKYTHLVVDEAHALEAAARTAFTRQLTERAIVRLADELSPSGRSRRGWLQRTPLVDGGKAVARIEELLRRLRKQVSTAFRNAEQHLPDARRAPFTSLDDLTFEFGEIPLLLKQVEDALDALADHIEDNEPLKELEGYIRLVQGTRSIAEAMEVPAPENMVHWYERDSRALMLQATPLDVAPLLEERLYPKLKALVLTSATLSLGGTFEYLCRSVGLSDDVMPIRTLIADSPFSYSDRMRIVVPRYLPSVQDELSPYAGSVADLITTLSARVARNGLALFTSYVMMHAVREHLPSEVKTLVQGELSRTALIDRFRNAEAPTWLLGTESFWEGVDFPRDELEILIIARLPFPVPTDPVLAALGDRMLRTGRDPFVDLSVPMTGLKLRQGIGRLIRTTGDRGLVFVTDQRIVTRPYGRLFAASLPVKVEIVSDETSLLQMATSWFGDDVERGGDRIQPGAVQD